MRLLNLGVFPTGLALAVTGLGVSCVQPTPMDNPDVDPHVSLCQGLLQRIVEERPLPQIHVLWGWRTDIATVEHTRTEGGRHVVSLAYEASTTPPDKDMPLRGHMTCEYPENPLWWKEEGDLSKEFECTLEEASLLPDRISTDGQQIRPDDLDRGRATIRAWADDVKQAFCRDARSSLVPPSQRSVNQRTSEEGWEASPWNRHDAHRACAPMLAALGTEESAPPGCKSLHMCIDEAELDNTERAKLYELIESTPDCPSP